MHEVFLHAANYFAEITCALRHLPKFNGSVHVPNPRGPPVNIPAEWATLCLGLQQLGVITKCQIEAFPIEFKQVADREPLDERAPPFDLIWFQWAVAISEVFNSIFGSWHLRKLQECA